MNSTSTKAAIPPAEFDLYSIPPLIGNDAVAPALRGRIRAARARLGARVAVLGHHYQRDDVIAFADKRGDSLDLSAYAADLPSVEYVVFCGVHFMAETADILTDASVRVILPDLRAGCSMADMAEIDQVEMAWDVLRAATPETIIPITYINSTADLKAFCGRNGGAVCTSSNARRVVQWALERGSKVLFFPDQHLGRNTCHDLGVALDDMVVYDPHDPNERTGGNPLSAYAEKRAILWRGHCSVHMNFKPNHPDLWRQRVPGINIIVHPECQFEVVHNADLAGSTKFIIETVANSPTGSKWAIGTEHHLVDRLRQEHPDKFITSLAPYACQCSTMFRISPEALCATLENLADGRERNVVSVPEETAKWATVALERMLELR
ncbi:MAG: quinolinate synthase NadA [Candidatus Sumerlaeia bacterium]|nr:quinolinate synthase NadA [Candidatus Sumerlaeia bacterium]